ncbi:MAG TPA: DUF5698 domain-containing protein [Cyclobacteriaceae bacterium]|jgi:uncharacterized protein YebE (UPF0316 family)|nr:DUF2179 domain-containing protein [Cytophagales bacterium]HRE66771.1 DUF5698 domain-containing protein [Cyclobacteriaceae bacterium]HRF33291.1 DUF5698 domain-containing protein [Cyclobacteriaceae bacterium]
MQEFFTQTLGLSENAFSFVVLPLLIFIARICDVSINTVRIIYMLGDRRVTATILGFFEAFIWLMAIRQIFQHLDNWLCYVAYPGGFAMGVLVGMMVEERLAYGKVIVRIITRKDIREFVSFLNQNRFRFTQVDAEGPDGPENLVFTVLERERLDELLNKLKEILPTAFYTIEKVKAAEESGELPEARRGQKVFTWLRGVVRN